MIKNTSKNTIIAKKTKPCNSLNEKALGLMFSKRDQDMGLIFNFESMQKISIHMLFVFYPIDILWLDDNNKVVWIKKNLAPFCLYYEPKFKARFMIEVVSGTIEKTNTEIGDTLFWDENIG